MEASTRLKRRRRAGTICKLSRSCFSESRIMKYMSARSPDVATAVANKSEKEQIADMPDRTEPRSQPFALKCSPSRCAHDDVIVLCTALAGQLARCQEQTRRIPRGFALTILQIPAYAIDDRQWPLEVEQRRRDGFKVTKRSDGAVPDLRFHRVHEICCREAVLQGWRRGYNSDCERRNEPGQGNRKQQRTVSPASFAS